MKESKDKLINCSCEPCQGIQYECTQNESEKLREMTTVIYKVIIIKTQVRQSIEDCQRINKYHNIIQYES